jgi:hypothetical protein
MNAIEIVLTGVVYLLGQGKGRPVQVVIPHVDAPAAPYGYVLPEHYAYVKVRTADVDNFSTATNPRFPDFVYRAEQGTTEFALYALHGDTIAVNGTNLLPDPLDICNKDVCPKTGYDLIPHQNDVCPDCGPLSNRYLLARPEPGLVAARMTLDRGTLTSANLDEKSEWSFEPFRFKFEGVKYHKQFIADQAVLKLNADGAVRLTVTPFDNNPLRTLTLDLKPDAKVEIGNLMLDDILPTRNPHAAEAVDIHFALFYPMLNGSVPADPPIPHRVTFPPAKPGGPRANCVPLRGTP